MRSRFKKVWCSSCSTMQFAGECPHGRVAYSNGGSALSAMMNEKGVDPAVKMIKSLAFMFGMPPGLRR